MATIQELQARIETANKAAVQLNQQRSVNIGKAETLQRQFDDLTAEYEKIYGVKLTAENLKSEIERVLEAQEKEVSVLETAIKAITEGRYAEAYGVLGIKDETADTNGFVSTSTPEPAVEIPTPTAVEPIVATVTEPEVVTVVEPEVAFTPASPVAVAEPEVVTVVEPEVVPEPTPVMPEPTPVMPEPTPVMPEPTKVEPIAPQAPKEPIEMAVASSATKVDVVAPPVPPAPPVSIAQEAKEVVSSAPTAPMPALAGFEKPLSAPPAVTPSETVETKEGNTKLGGTPKSFEAVLGGVQFKNKE